MKPIVEAIPPRWLRVVSPSWPDPVDASYSSRLGGRWNAPGGPQTLYLCDTVSTARAQVRRLFADRFIDLEDLRDDAIHLINVEVPTGSMADAHTDSGLAALGLPPTYPLDQNAETVTHSVCQKIGDELFLHGVDGVCARSAARSASRNNLELAWYARGRVPAVVGAPMRYGAWL